MDSELFLDFEILEDVILNLFHLKTSLFSNFSFGILKQLL